MGKNDRQFDQSFPTKNQYIRNRNALMNTAPATRWMNRIFAIRKGVWLAVDNLGHR